MLRTFDFRPALFLSVLSVCLCVPALHAQQQQTYAPQRYIDEGLKLQKEGNYTQAIENYHMALKQNPKYDEANYQTALSYFSLGEYKKSITYCDRTLKAKSPYMDEAYLLKGNALYALGRTEEAVQEYIFSLQYNPENYLTHYALASAQYKLGYLDQAENTVIYALGLKPTNAESHLLLGRIMMDKREGIKSMLALANFLLLQPRGPKAEKAYADLQALLSGNAQKASEHILSADLNTGMPADEFKSAELIVSLLLAQKTGGRSVNDSESHTFIDHAMTLFGTLNDLQRNKSDFWWNFYVYFYNDMSDDNQIETLCYFISQSKPVEFVQDWLSENHVKVDRLIDWVNAYPRKY